jgi:glucosamine kinase
MEAVMAERLFLGIDGGGTTSRARLTDAEGRVLGEGRAGSSNLILGMVVATEAVLLAARDAIAAAGLSDHRMGDISAGLGLAGANVPSLAETLLNVRFPFASVALASDAEIACLGAFGGEDGAILILGTGSQGLAMVDGKATSIGGWGFELSDEGSGAVLGRAAIRSAMLAIDDLGPATGLTEAIMARFGADPAAAALWAKTATSRDFGAFAPLVVEHFSEGDPVAVELLTASTRSVTQMLKRLIQLGARRIALMGGMAGTYLPLLPEDMASHIVEPRGDALDGALALARGSVAR